jgi:hypothetical protein
MPRLRRWFFFCGGTILNDREYAEKERGGAGGFVLR